TALEEDLATDDLARTLQAHDAERRHRLTAARFPDDAQRLSGIQLERHPVARFDDAFRREELRLEVMQLEQRTRQRGLPEPWIEGVADGVAEQVGGQDRDEDGQSRPDDQPA